MLVFFVLYLYLPSQWTFNVNEHGDGEETTSGVSWEG
jgi:hypothetical protein